MRLTTLASMSAALLPFALVFVAGCPSSPSSTAAGSSSATTAAKPVPSGLPIARLNVFPTRSAGTYRVDLSALHQAIALATAGELPVAKTTDGLRVLRADEGSVLERAGFRVDDELVRIANVPVLTPDLLVQLHPVWDQPQFQIAYRRGGQERSHTYELQQARPPRPTPRAGDEGGGEPVPFDQEAFAKMVVRSADGSFEVKRKALDMLLESQSTFMRSARVVPQTEGGAVVGLKLFGIRRGSPIAVLGFENGDAVRTANGYDLSNPEKALEAYSKLKKVTTLDVVIVRDGKPLTLRYRVTK